MIKDARKTHKKSLQRITEGKERGQKTESEKIREYILSAKKITVPNWDGKKLESINRTLKKFGLPKAKGLKINTNAADLTRMPTITKALMAVDTTDSDLIIARGRLGVPGSGSMLVIMDHKGRILSQPYPPTTSFHGKSLQEAVEEELKNSPQGYGL